jgi:transcriptional regulator with XRE-family HTH domain
MRHIVKQLCYLWDHMLTQTAPASPQALRAARRDKGLSVEEAALAIGVSRGTLSRAERGKTTPHPGTGLKIAGFYGLKPSEVWPVMPHEAAA